MCSHYTGGICQKRVSCWESTPKGWDNVND